MLFTTFLYVYKIKKNKLSQQVKQKMTFREDIQGLRALAVLSVVISYQPLPFTWGLHRRRHFLCYIWLSHHGTDIQ